MGVAHVFNCKSIFGGFDLNQSEQELKLFEAASSVASSLSCSIFDVELKPGHVKVVVDKDGGVDLDTLEEINKRLCVHSGFLSVFDPNKHSLEVTSPGIERKLRLPDHFMRFLGEKIKLKLKAGNPERRITGTLIEATEKSICVRKDSDGQVLELELSEVESAHTVYDWPESFSPKGDKSK